MYLEIRTAKKWLKCCCCEEQIRTAEQFLQVVDNGEDIRGERYCPDCEEYAFENNPGLHSSQNDDENWQSESHLRSMEDFAEYKYNGNTNAYWDDRDAGYAH